MSLAQTGADLDEAVPADAPPPVRESRWAGWVVTGVAGLTPLIAYLWSLGFAAIVALAGLLCLPLLYRSRRPDLGQGLLLALVLWALASMAWGVAVPAAPRDFSVESMTGLKLALQLGLYGAFVGGALMLSKAAGARASLVLAVGLLAITVVFGIDAVTKAEIYQWIRAAAGQPQRPDWAMRDVARVAYVLALLFWPAYLRLEQAGWPIPAGIMAAAMVGGGYLLNADAPLAALAVSAAVFMAVRFWGRPALLAWVGGVAFYFLAAPLIVHALGNGPLIQAAEGDIRVQSWAIRTDIWRFAADRILERPFLGWGLDAARTFSPQIPLHTHNAAIQIWLELGAIGAGIATLFWLWLGGRIDAMEARDRPLAATCAACASAYLTIGALSFGVWQEWWLGLGALAVASCAALAAARRGMVFSPPPGGEGGSAPAERGGGAPAPDTAITTDDAPNL